MLLSKWETSRNVNNRWWGCYSDIYIEYEACTENGHCLFKSTDSKAVDIFIADWNLRSRYNGMG